MGRIAKFSLFLFLLVHFCEIHAANFTRHELLKYLTNVSTYDSNYPSGYDKGNANVVKVQMDIFDLTSISDQNMEFSIMMLMRMQWQDDRLAYFQLANYSRLDLTGDMINLVWTPDLYISNERKTDAHSLVKHEELVYIDPKGVVSFSIRLSMTSNCHMDLKLYPFDVQTCDVTIQSYAFTVDKIILNWSDNSVQIGDLNLPNYEVSVDSHTQGNMSNGNMSLTVKDRSVCSIEPMLPEAHTQRVDINISRADELINNDRIDFAPRQGTFTIPGQDDKARVVTIFPESCSCGCTKCCHLIAVKKSLGMDLNSKAKPNLTILRGLDEKKKAGRKRPRVGDYDYESSPDKTRDKRGVTEIRFFCDGPGHY
ncbi:glycine receptor subunit alpha-2-like [Mercenaria mercenaria]|uniref:glycine receptor subunit alpha-2-like n=1 Tax=Mercenaria mercenaria TaxID=6596 RepID=UPI00234E3907|nr:glycine receptor subunit alpha-2-like [Mercenaria mercenaria]